jgi:hypothetical protein
LRSIEPLENRTLLSVNLIANGDFSRGAVGFTSGLNKGGTSLVPTGTYVVGTNPHTYHPGGASFGDHTTGTGKMLLANDSTVPNVTLWRETIVTTPGVEYSFTGWAAAWATDGPDQGDISPAEPQLVVNGKPIVSETLPTTAGQWTPLTGTWVATSLRSTLILTDLNTSAAGNDSAYDDFSAAPLASIHGTAIADVNVMIHGKIRHQIKALPGVTVYLDTNNDGILDDGEQAAVTNRLGAYTFIGLAPGSYQVRQAVSPEAPIGNGVTVSTRTVPISAGRQLARQNLWDYFSSSSLVAGVFD